MSNLTINANSIYDRVIRIGRQTENLVSSITFNVNMWIEEYGAGECVLNVERNGDGSAYPVPMTITDGMTTWTITDTDTAKKGRGEIQLTYTVGEKVKTSPIFTISCGESLVGGEVPEPYEEWLTELNRMTAQVEAAKTSADQSAQAAQTAAQTATEKATEAEQSANTASGFANNASASATSARTSAQAASQSAQVASVARTAAEAAAVSAQAEAEDAEAAKTAAQTAEANAQASAQTASTKASEAAESAAQAQASADRANVDILRFLPTDSASGAIASFSDGADNVPLKSLVVGINPVQSGEGDPSPENIRPISGRTGMNLWKCGKNLIDPSKRTKASNTIYRWYAVDGFVLKQGTTYTLSSDAESTAVYFRTMDGTNLKGGHATETYTPSEDITVNFQIYKLSGADAVNIMLEVGSAATDYEPYICTEIPISWETEVGTVYGGSLDVLTGVLTVTDAVIASYNGETLPSTWISDRDVYSTGATPTTGAQVVYKLSEPIEITLDPHEVSSLLGQNNIYAETGDTSVEYRADIQRYIDKRLSR